MDLTPTDEQRLLAETARLFVDREFPPDRARPGAADVAPVDLWPAMCALGWPSIAVASLDGGAGAGLLELAMVCEQLGRGPVPSPLVVSSVLAAYPIAAAGTADQRARWLPALAAGGTIATLAPLEPGARDEWERPGMSGGATLQGTKVLVPWADVAGVVVVPTADGLYVVEPDPATCTVTRHDDLGADPVFAVELAGAPAERLGAAPANRHAQILAQALDRAAVVALAEAVGSAERVIELTVGHARDREQFGRPIGSFQAVAHRCVDMRTDVDACRFLAYQAAWALDRLTDPGLEVAAALGYAKEALRRVLIHAHQVHGAIGFSTEHDLHRFTRRAKAFELSYGSAGRHLEAVARHMGLGRSPSVGAVTR